MYLFFFFLQKGAQKGILFLQLLLLSKSGTQSTSELLSECQETKMKHKRKSLVLFVINIFNIPTGFARRREEVRHPLLNFSLKPSHT